jgi:hypothetical protein
MTDYADPLKRERLRKRPLTPLQKEALGAIARGEARVIHHYAPGCGYSCNVVNKSGRIIDSQYRALFARRWVSLVDDKAGGHRRPMITDDCPAEIVMAAAL